MRTIATPKFLSRNKPKMHNAVVLPKQIRISKDKKDTGYELQKTCRLHLQGERAVCLVTVN